MATNNPFAPKKATTTEQNQPVAEVLIKLGNLVIASRSVWEEEKSRTQAYNDLNVMAKDEPEKLVEILKANAHNLTFEVRSNEVGQGDSLEDVLDSLGK